MGFMVVSVLVVLLVPGVVVAASPYSAFLVVLSPRDLAVRPRGGPPASSGAAISGQVGGRAQLVRRQTSG
jgi:hypothetical protein